MDYSDLDRPNQILGQAIFTTRAGLYAEGTGVLADVENTSEFLEFRTPDTKKLLRDGCACGVQLMLFAQRAPLHDQSAIVVGLLRVVPDNSGRFGIQGACVAVNEGPGSAAEAYKPLFRLFADFEKFYRHRHQTSTSARLGYFSPEVARTHLSPVSDKFKAFYAICEFPEAGQIEPVILAAQGFPRVGRAFLLASPSPMTGYPELTRELHDELLARVSKHRNGAVAQDQRHATARTPDMQVNETHSDSSWASLVAMQERLRAIENELRRRNVRLEPNSVPSFPGGQGFPQVSFEDCLANLDYRLSYIERLADGSKSAKRYADDPTNKKPYNGGSKKKRGGEYNWIEEIMYFFEDNKNTIIITILAIVLSAMVVFTSFYVLSDGMRSAGFGKSETNTDSKQ